MTWGELWRYFKLVIRSRLARHRLCGSCGSALTLYIDPQYVSKEFRETWSCDDCTELKKQLVLARPAVSINGAQRISVTNCYFQNNQYIKIATPPRL